MMQLDLALSAPPIPRCGLCVHRNGSDGDEIAPCSPMGERHRDAMPCPWAFGKTELKLATARRP
jgi:hypothetical protein